MIFSWKYGKGDKTENLTLIFYKSKRLLTFNDFEVMSMVLSFSGLIKML